MFRRLLSPQLTKKAKKPIEYIEGQHSKRLQNVVLFLSIITTVCTVVFAAKVLPYKFDLKRSKRELVELHELTEQRRSSFGADMQQINSDYVGMIIIEGTNIGYHVVRGNDNEKYLSTTFFGDRNALGSIFMDYRCTGEYVPHLLIYGHNCYDDDGNWHMFGGLLEFRDEEYLAAHPTILYMENDHVSEFRIFSARETDINDPAYYLDFNTPGLFAAFAERNGAPADAERIITLSTCIGANNERRMIVQGVLRSVHPVELEYDENGLHMTMQKTA